MTMKHLYKVLFTALTLVTSAGCESPVEEGGKEPLSIWFAPHFVIKNESSREQVIELKKAYCYPNFDMPSKEMYWGFQEGEAGSPVSCTLKIGTEAALETWTGARIGIHFPAVLSFVLIIDDKRYAGWTADIGIADISITDYGLGYVAVNPEDLEELNQAIATSEETIDLTKYRLPVLTSVLPAGSLEPTDNPLYIDATYIVTITDNTVEVVLKKQTIHKTTL